MGLSLAIAGLGVLFFLSLFSLLYALTMRRVSVRDRILEEEDLSQMTFAQRLQYTADRWIAPLGRLLVRSPGEVLRQRGMLVVAGYRQKEAVFLYYGAKVGTALVFLLLFSVTGTVFSKPLLSVLLAFGLGLILPSMWLNWRIHRRKERLQLALPDMMDLSVVCVEAGLGLDQALVRIGRELRGPHPDLSDELRAYELETNAGMSRVVALRNLATRTDLDDLKALTAVLVQADRFGTSIGQSLRIFSDSLRTKRRQLAEERAAKLNVKMVVPLVIFIFPAIVVVVVGPAVVKIAHQLIPILSSGR